MRFQIRSLNRQWYCKWEHKSSLGSLTLILLLNVGQRKRMLLLHSRYFIKISETDKIMQLLRVKNIQKSQKSSNYNKIADKTDKIHILNIDWCNEILKYVCKCRIKWMIVKPFSFVSLINRVRHCKLSNLISSYTVYIFIYYVADKFPNLRYDEASSRTSHKSCFVNRAVFLFFCKNLLYI